MSQKMEISEADVLEALQTVYDPELGLDIVSLGLIYEIKIHQDTVQVLMTLTTPGCPMHDAIGMGAEWTLKQLPGINNVEIEADLGATLEAQPHERGGSLCARFRSLREDLPAARFQVRDCSLLLREEKSDAHYCYSSC